MLPTPFVGGVLTRQLIRHASAYMSVTLVVKGFMRCCCCQVSFHSSASEMLRGCRKSFLLQRYAATKEEEIGGREKPQFVSSSRSRFCGFRAWPNGCRYAKLAAALHTLCIRYLAVWLVSVFLQYSDPRDYERLECFMCR